MAFEQEAVFERLLRWVQQQCQLLSKDAGDEDSSEQDVQPLLRHALKVLIARPSYYRCGSCPCGTGAAVLICLCLLLRHCQDCVASTRRSTLVRRFIGALTKGGPNGFPRPIEVHAHDPLRYLGDMLAWIHQALAGEREVVLSLFGAPLTRTAEPAHVDETDTTVDPLEVLDRIFDGVVRPLKVRFACAVQSSAMLLAPILCCSPC